MAGAARLAADNGVPACSSRGRSDLHRSSERTVSGMGDSDDLEVTREGLLGLLAGKAKEAAGTLVGNDELARDGRLQQAQIDEEAEAARDETGKQLGIGDRVKLDDGREGQVIEFDGRKIDESGGVGGSAKVRLDDGTIIDVGPARITQL
jgi:uncharacterized protein YjbJ (UPF0337 family)